MTSGALVTNFREVKFGISHGYRDFLYLLCSTTIALSSLSPSYSLTLCLTFSLSLFTQYLSFRLLSLCREFLNPRKGNEGVSDNALITTERSTPTEFRGKLDFLAGPGAFQRKEGGVVRCLVETALSPHHYRPCSGPVASNALKSASVTQTRHRDHPPVVYSSRTITVEEIHKRPKKNSKTK